MLGLYRDLESDEKKYVNEEIFAPKVKTLSTEGLVVILDSIKLQTTHALLKSGIEPLRIRIVERNSFLYSKMKRKLKILSLSSVEIVHSDLFDYCDFLANSQTKVVAVFADLMCSDINEVETGILTNVCQKCDVDNLFITLCGRSKAGDTVSKRVQRIRDSSLYKFMRGIYLIHGYKRTENSTPMVVICMQREPCQLLLRPKKIHRYNQDLSLVLVQGWLLPDKLDWIWMPESEIKNTKLLNLFFKRRKIVKNKTKEDLVELQSKDQSEKDAMLEQDQTLQKENEKDNVVHNRLQRSGQNSATNARLQEFFLAKRRNVQLGELAFRNNPPLPNYAKNIVITRTIYEHLATDENFKAGDCIFVSYRGRELTVQVVDICMPYQFSILNIGNISNKNKHKSERRN